MAIKRVFPTDACRKALQAYGKKTLRAEEIAEFTALYGEEIINYKIREVSVFGQYFTEAYFNIGEGFYRLTVIFKKDFIELLRSYNHAEVIALLKVLQEDFLVINRCLKLKIRK